MQLSHQLIESFDFQWSIHSLCPSPQLIESLLSMWLLTIYRKHILILPIALSLHLSVCHTILKMGVGPRTQMKKKSRQQINKVRSTGLMSHMAAGRLAVNFPRWIPAARSSRMPPQVYELQPSKRWRRWSDCGRRRFAEHSNAANVFFCCCRPEAFAYNRIACKTRKIRISARNAFGCVCRPLAHWEPRPDE